MARDLAIGKRLKIDKAKQNMLAAVAGASFALGACLVLGVYFLKYIRFDAAIVSAKNEAIQGYSDTIKNVGVCKAPRGKTYSATELESCSPNEIRPSEVSNSLRYKTIVTMAQNKALESVGRNSLQVCMNTATGEKKTYEELYEEYEYASESEKSLYFGIFSMCSALRTIPDALPSAKNELALGSSLDKIFNESSFEPDTISPGGEKDSELTGVGAIGVSLAVKASNATVMSVIYNIERSIREIAIDTATIEWVGENQISLNASATAYYTGVAGLEDGIITVKGDGKVSKSLGGAEE